MTDATKPGVPPGPDGAPSIVELGRILEYPVCDEFGRLQGISCRRYRGNDKDVWWLGPDRQLGLNGRRDTSMPLYGTELLSAIPMDVPITLAEGPRATDAIRNAGWHALGTMCGASRTPADAVLRALDGRPVILWADNDPAGLQHMLAIYPRLFRVHSVGWAEWKAAPHKGDAADASVDQIRRTLNEAFDVGVPSEPPPPLRRSAPSRPGRRRGPIAGFKREVDACDVLVLCFGFEPDHGQAGGHVARPGTTVQCIGHPDRRPSMSILPDRQRVFCHNPNCPINNDGHGMDSWDLLCIAEVSRAAIR